MWWLKRKKAIPKASDEVQPPVVTPMRRIEITVERHSITRFSRSNTADPAEITEPQPQLPAPPDG
ncbi:MAG: hypothetical protein ABR976_21305 [Terracidiphilus sp.]|jgi:hypothetical protein